MKFLPSNPKPKPKKATSAHKLFSRELMSIGYLKNKGEEEKRLQKLGMVKDHSLSQKKDKVYVDKAGKAHVVYKGTDPKDIGDLATDVALTVGLGRFTPRFRNAKRLAKKVKEKYCNSTIKIIISNRKTINILAMKNKNN